VVSGDGRKCENCYSSKRVCLFAQVNIARDASKLAAP
jgi:hypothetical protein